MVWFALSGLIVGVEKTVPVPLPTFIVVIILHIPYPFTDATALPPMPLIHIS
jgi:hypothetical protein